MALVYRNEAGGQPWANRLAEGASLVYVLKLRDRCRSGLSGSPGKRVLGKTNRGFESLPVRTLVRRGNSIRRRRYLDGSQGNGGPIPPCPNASEDRVSHIPEGKNGWRKGRSEGAQSRPQSIFEKLTNPSLTVFF